MQDWIWGTSQSNTRSVATGGAGGGGGGSSGGGDASPLAAVDVRAPPAPLALSLSAHASPLRRRSSMPGEGELEGGRRCGGEFGPSGPGADPVSVSARSAGGGGGGHGLGGGYDGSPSGTPGSSSFHGGEIGGETEERRLRRTLRRLLLTSLALSDSVMMAEATGEGDCIL